MEIIRTGLGSLFEHPKWNTHDRLFVVPPNIEEPSNQQSIQQTNTKKKQITVVHALECVRISWDIDVSFVVSQIKKKTKRINDRMSNRMDPSSIQCLCRTSRIFLYSNFYVRISMYFLVHHPTNNDYPSNIQSC